MQTKNVFCATGNSTLMEGSTTIFSGKKGLMNVAKVFRVGEGRFMQGAFFLKRVPLVALRASAQPFGGGGAAVGAEEDGAWFCDGWVMCPRRFVTHCVTNYV